MPARHGGYGHILKENVGRTENAQRYVIKSLESIKRPSSANRRSAFDYRPVYPVTYFFP